MDTEVYKLRLARWQKLIYEANTCGMKKTEWCRMNGVSTKQFYYWQKKVRAVALDELRGENGLDNEGQEPLAGGHLPAFVELRPPAASCCPPDRSPVLREDPSEAPLTLQFGRFQLQIRENASESMLRMALRALGDA